MVVLVTVMMIVIMVMGICKMLMKKRPSMQHLCLLNIYTTLCILSKIKLHVSNCCKIKIDQSNTTVYVNCMYKTNTNQRQQSIIGA
jgi:hypothetical protein